MILFSCFLDRQSYRRRSMFAARDGSMTPDGGTSRKSFAAGQIPRLINGWILFAAGSARIRCTIAYKHRHRSTQQHTR
jgi:hypothetical protein